MLAQQAARWTRDNAGKLAKADPPALDNLDDRAHDNWRALLAIADAAGGQWPKKAHDAAEKLVA